MKKKFWQSKTAWVNLAAVVVMGVQWAAGVEIISLEAQAAALAIINLILRLITNQGLTK